MTYAQRLLSIGRYIFQSCTSELRAWFRALLEAIPGELGCLFRRLFYGFVSGSGTRVLAHVTIYHPGRLTMGRNVGISSHTQMNAGGGIVIGDDVLIGPGVLIWSQNHQFGSLEVPISHQDYDSAKVTIEQGSWLAAGVIVLPGVRIAQGTVVAAGAVVTRSTEPFSIVAGVPAKPIGTRLRKA